MPSVIQSRRFNRREIAAGSLAGAVALLGASVGNTSARVATPDATPVVEGTKKFLAVADPDAQHLYIYSLPDLKLLDTVGGVVVNTHAGFIPLPNRKLLFIDDANSRLMAIEVHGDHLHSHETLIPGKVFSHIAIDSDHAHYAAVGSDDPEAPITLVNLESWEVTPVAVQEPGEVGLFLTHDILFHRNNNLNQIEAYSLESVLAGTVEILATVQIGAGGHGESITMSGDILYTATDEGIDAVAWDGKELTFLTTYPWESADRNVGRGYFQRLSLDGSQLVSYTANREAPETEWTTWANDAVLIDTAEGVTNRIDLGTGYVYRFGLSQATALFYRIGGEGDEAIILDLARGEVTTRIPLDPMSKGPVASESIYENNQYRAVTSTVDGTVGFVTQGGDGKVVVLDLAGGMIVDSIATESPLNGGGHLAVFGAPESFADTIGR